MRDGADQAIFDIMSTVSRRDRLTDLAALVLILAGIALYLDGAARLRAISAYSYQHPGPRGQSALVAADHARYEANGGIALAAAGCLVGVVSALRHARRRPVS
jgi:hypothetical protein